MEELKEEQPKSKSKDNTKQVELKLLPSSLRYSFLDSTSQNPVIVNTGLSNVEEEKLLKDLRTHNKAIGYKIEDQKGLVLQFACIGYL